MNSTIFLVSVLLSAAVLAVRAESMGDCVESCDCSFGDDCTLCPLESLSTTLDCDMCYGTGQDEFDIIPKDCAAGCYYCDSCGSETALRIENSVDEDYTETCNCNPSNFTEDNGVFIKRGESIDMPFTDSDGYSCSRTLTCSKSSTSDNYATTATVTCNSPSSTTEKDDSTTMAVEMTTTTEVDDTTTTVVDDTTTTVVDDTTSAEDKTTTSSYSTTTTSAGGISPGDGECGSPGHVYKPVESCTGFTQTTMNGVFGPTYCPIGLLFDFNICVCTWPNAVTCLV